ncbi:MAG TPA: RIP metalloprotease RseP [Kiloniellaceae bacterium]|nr:RIP metalloprotease RseP [Kiloniellaceae bacterium]
MEFTEGLYGFGLPFLIILTILVFVHELGHYWVARRCGVRVEVFSVGFGPELFGFNDAHGTRWKFSLVPLGGYVKMFGDANAASMPDGQAVAFSEAEKKEAFQYKTLAQRSWIVAAGPLVNFLFAILVFSGLFSTLGQPFSPPIVGAVVPDSPAAAAGFEAGDRIVAIDNSDIERFEDLLRIVSLHPEQEMQFSVERDGATVTFPATPARVVADDGLGNEQEIGRLGIQGGAMEFVQYNLPTAIWRATKETVEISGTTLQAVYQIITGQRSFRELGGPLRIAQMSGQVAERGVVPAIILMAILSINLGLINLFPIPMLDGGHLLFYAIEGVRGGRPLGERAQEYGFRIGLALVMTLIAVVTWNDLVHIDIVDFVMGLAG